MKNKIKIILILALAFGVTHPLQAINVNPASGPYNVGQVLYFSASNYYWDYASGILNFGDGNVHRYARNSSSVAHQYLRAGVYQLSIVDEIPYSNFSPEYLTITIIDNRHITYSPINPIAGQTITFTAMNFVTPQNIRWDFGDGVIVTQHESNSTAKAGHQVTHRYTRPGTYTVKAYDWDGSDTIPITINTTIGQPARSITSNFNSPREDQAVRLQAINFLSQTIDWNFGDGNLASGSSIQTHRFMREGRVTVSALDRDFTQTPTTINLHILPENRSISASQSTIILNQSVTLTALMFRGDGVLWDFGDGTQIIGSHQETHLYTRSGHYTISARDESGQSQRFFTTELTVQGITDTVSLHKAELRFDNGHAYRIVAKGSRHLQAELQMKMEGTGLITGMWIIDGQPFSQFSQFANQGVVTTIKTGLAPSLPTIDPGLHRLTVRLTRPVSESLPEINYFVEPGSALLETLEPQEGIVIPEDKVPRFGWSEIRGASWYEIGFADSLYPFLFAPSSVKWSIIREGNSCLPDARQWAAIPRNRPVFWQIRAKDSANQLISQGEPREIQLRLSPATISVTSITALTGKPISLPTNKLPDQLLLRGTITFLSEEQFMMLRVFADDQMVNQLLYRKVTPNAAVPFTSSAPARGHRRITLQVLKPSTPAVVIGVHHIELIR